MKYSTCSIYDGLVGAIVGDYMGLPYVGKARRHLSGLLALHPTGCGSYGKEAGTWSAPGSLLLATTASLIRCGLQINYGDLMDSFAAWMLDGAFTPDGDPLPGSSTIAEAVDRYRDGLEVLSCGSSSLRDNGNGALTRILPLAYVEAGIKDVFCVSALTHARLLSQLACWIYVSFVRSLLCRKSGSRAAEEPDLRPVRAEFESLLLQLAREEAFAPFFKKGYLDRLAFIDREPAERINSTSYVLDSLEAALWSFFTTDSYATCILEAVHLGYDTSATASLAGALAGIFYGVEGIPAEWLASCRDLQMIQKTADEFDRCSHDLR